MTQINFWMNKSILITGICGTIGSELLARLSNVRNLRIVGLDSDLQGIKNLQQRLGALPNVEIILMDICDAEGVARIARNVDYIIHAAAIKHVDRCEGEPLQAAMVNVAGLRNVINSALVGGVQKVLFTSSDKAVEPTSAMGATKLLGERLIASQASNQTDNGTVFASIRFGNVCGSSASVIPKFKQQIAQGGPVTVTDPEMTRFVMQLSHAADLILKALEFAKGGEIFVPKMQSLRISTLAKVMIDALALDYGHDPFAIQIQYIGAGVAERMFEKLMTDFELGSLLNSEHFFVIEPPATILNFSKVNQENIEAKSRLDVINSSADAPMSYDDTHRFLIGAGLLSIEASISYPSK